LKKKEQSWREKTEQKEGEMEKERKGFRHTEGERRVGGKQNVLFNQLMILLLTVVGLL